MFTYAVVDQYEGLVVWSAILARHILANSLSTAIVYKYMSTSPSEGDDKRTPPAISTVILLLGTIADTTWRMFIPTIGLLVLGLLIDRRLHTTPWIMILGLLVGTYLAYVLVQRQIKKVTKNDK